MFNKKNFKEDIELILKIKYGNKLENALEEEKFYAISKAIMNILIDDWNKTKNKYNKGKEAYYFSAEYLMGRALGNNLINLGIYDEIKEVLSELNIDLNDIESKEEDAGLGNGGLGRLAACFMDSSATLNLPLTGYGLRYNYGIFEQAFGDGFQLEKANDWLKNDDPWSIKKEDETVIVNLNNKTIRAVPYDTPIIGYDTKNINTLRLWEAHPIENFDFSLFNDQEYDKAVEKKNRAEDITRVLYPNDSTEKGKILRLEQQYLLASASLKDLIRKFKNKNIDISNFPQYNKIQLNDTHPVVAIPELIRILIDEEGTDFDTAWNICKQTFSYTNHTILQEALEKWYVPLFREVLPRIYEIITIISEKLIDELKHNELSEDKVNNMKIINHDLIHMAWLAIYACHTVNGVAALHTEILKNQELNNWYELYPEKFQNKTNGITPRRWLALSNPELTNFLEELLGTKDFIKDLDMLKKLEKFIDDEEKLNKLLEIKKEKKLQLKEYIKIQESIEIDENSIFDIQIKRLHEYKRQLLNAFHILDLYYRLKENPSMNIEKRTFIFGAKAAPGYFRAKAIIKYINEIAKLINNDEEIKGKIKVVFVHNYNVSYGEKLFPAADLSEQISTAGKEASGTGNMKFMLNATPTIGTLDGANVEIVEEAGMENNFIFGAHSEEIEEMKKNDSYNPREYYENVKGLKRVVDTLIDGTFDDNSTGMFRNIYDSLLNTNGWERPDNYFIFKDFDDYRRAQEHVDKAYKDKRNWAKKCWMNMINAGKFNSDRTISQYAKEIWNIDSKKI